MFCMSNPSQPRTPAGNGRASGRFAETQHQEPAVALASTSTVEETRRAQAEAYYPVEDWEYEVANGDTRLGYDEWVDHKVEADGFRTADQVELIYRDASGGEHAQPVSDLEEVGTLVDPDTGDDMPIVGVRTDGQMIDATILYQDESGAIHEQPAGDVVYSGTLIDPDTGDDMPIVGALTRPEPPLRSTGNPTAGTSVVAEPETETPSTRKQVTDYDRGVARTIYDQIGPLAAGNMDAKARNAETIPNGIRMRQCLMGARKRVDIEVTLNGADLYDVTVERSMTLRNPGGEQVFSTTDVSVSQIRELVLDIGDGNQDKLSGWAQ